MPFFIGFRTCLKVEPPMEIGGP